MPLSRPFFSHRIASTGLRTIVQSAEAAVLYLLFWLLSKAVGAFILHDGPFELADELWFAALLLTCAVAGGALYAGCRALVARRGIDTTLSVRVWLLLLTGALLGALLSIVYWLRPTAPGEFSRPTFTLLMICAGAGMALMLGGIVAWQNLLVRASRVA
jgi:hypothetical protein